MTYNTIFKFEDVRRDQMIMILIKLIKIILKKDDNIELPILTYNIRPTGLNNGFVELVPDTQTIYFIKETCRFTLLNYIIENNKDKKIDDIKKQFLRSCAIYCVITYVFGIGDRHLDNIMITKDGTLFHIDYSYILGSDPKPLTNPTMRISIDMIDVLGGLNSQYYLEFKQLCNQIYNTIRRHVNYFQSFSSHFLNRIHQ